MTSHTMRHLDDRRARDEAIAESLVVPFTVTVFNVLRHGVPEVPLSDRNQAVQALFFDRPDEAFRVRIRIRRALGSEDEVGSRVPELTPHVAAPLAIPIADQYVHRWQRAVLGHRQRPDDLLHEQRLGMRGGPEDLHTT
jgi:hypothetical protein